jgi:hypothetical protein
MAETRQIHFVMNGARAAIAAGLAHIEQQVESLEYAVLENPALAFDLAKTIVESVCRTVLRDRSIAFSETDDLPRLFKLVSQSMPFLPPAVSSEGEIRKSLDKTLNGLHTAILGICELRNQCGFASHGSDKPRPALETVQAQLAAETADTIIGFLYRVHLQDRTTPALRALYGDNPAFNDWVDDQYGPIRVFEIEFRPSEVLFQMEPESYRVYLAEFKPESEAGVLVTDEESQVQETP